ncbi:MAG TPA: hypothetical protein VGD49_02290, partial [Longimicrobiales bacterium]
ASLDNAGDIIVFGAYDPERNLCICFDDQVGAHGAMGGQQFWPFLMHGPGLVADDYEINDPLDLFPIFMRYREAGSFRNGAIYAATTRAADADGKGDSG